MFKNALLIATFCLLSYRCEVAQAQLSQLDFDKPVLTIEKQRSAHVEKQAELIKTVLSGGERARLADPEEPYSSTPPPVTKKTRLAEIDESIEVAFDVKDSPSERSKRRFTPRLKGPFHDPGEPSHITSRHRWEPNEEGRCAGPTAKKDIENKANALREILFRFNGTDEPYDGLVENYCAPRCAPDASVLLGLAMHSTGGTSFTIARNKDQCRYRIHKSADSDWQEVEASKVVCSCKEK